MRTGKYLGYRDKINADLKLGMTGLWALLQEKVEGLKLEIEKEVTSGKTFEYNIEMPTSARLQVAGKWQHIVRWRMSEEE